MINFDHAAAAEVLPEVKKAYPQLLEQYSGNPEAAHSRGYELRNQIKKLEAELWRTMLPQQPDMHGAFFADSATTLINAAGAVFGGKGSALASELDHPAAEKMLKRSFKNVCYMPLDCNGRITEIPVGVQDVQFIYLTLLQSEIGVLQDLELLLPALRKKYPDAFIMLDAVQFARFYPYCAEVLPDGLLISGAKLGAASGAALLVGGRHFTNVKNAFDDLRKRDYLIARSDPVSAAALVMAAKNIQESRAEELLRCREINHFLRSKLQDLVLPSGNKLQFTVPQEFAAENILHMILPGFQSGVLVRMFAQHGVLLSAGSACASESKEPSKVLQALNYSSKDSYSGLRLSFSGSNTLKEAEEFLQIFEQILKDY